MSDDFDDLKYKFNFSRATMPELVEVGMYSQLAIETGLPVYSIIANTRVWALATKVSETDVNQIPADMMVIFLNEFTEAFKEWTKELGWSK